MTFEDLNAVTGQAIRRYLNGTVAVFNVTTNKLLSYIGPVPKFYTGCVLVNTAGATTSGVSSGQQLFRCWNNTIRLIPAPL
jgi:hypothetical protein